MRERERERKNRDQIQFLYACTRCPKMIGNIIFAHLVRMYSAHIYLYILFYVFAKLEKIERNV